MALEDLENIMKNQHVTIAILISCLIHICVILLFSRTNSNYLNKKKLVHLKKKYTKLQTVGIKNGQEKFSRKLKAGTTLKKIEAKTQKSSPMDVITKKSPGILNRQKLKQLAPNSSLIPHKQSRQKPTDSPTYISPQKVDQLQKVKQLTIKNLSTSVQNKEIIQKTGFFFKFVPPKGIPEDELNSIEKIFYSFQKRTYQSYVSSLLSHYGALVTQRPYVIKTLFSAKQLLTGRISIDVDGNITRVRFIKSSENKDIQELFEKTLTGIQALPNPPKELLRGGEELQIYFQLIISDK